MISDQAPQRSSACLESVTRPAAEQQRSYACVRGGSGRGTTQLAELKRAAPRVGYLGSRVQGCGVLVQGLESGGLVWVRRSVEGVQQMQGSWESLPHN